MDIRDDYSFCSGSNSESSSLSSEDKEDSFCDFDFNLELIQESCDQYGNLFYLQSFRSLSLDPTMVQPPGSERDQNFKHKKRAQFNPVNSRLSKWIAEERKLRISLKRSIQRNWKSFKSGAPSKSKRNLPNKLNEDEISVKRETPEDIKKDSFFQLIQKGLLETSIISEKPFTLIYLASPSDNSKNKDYAVFVYPITCSSDDNLPNDGNKSNFTPSSQSQRLIKLKGMFVSLSQVVNDITGQLPILSKVDVYGKDANQEITTKSINAGDRTFNVAFLQEFTNNLVVAMAADEYSETETISLATTLGRTFRFLYNSLDATFKNPKNHGKIEYFLEIVSHILLESSDENNLCIYMDLVHKVIIESDLLLAIDEALSEYESMDWLSDSCIEHDGQISSACDMVILGSALFYKKYLISSHLPPQYLGDLVAFIKMRGIISLIENQPIKLVLWHEVFPSSQSNDPLAADFKENEGSRFFLMAVAIEYALLCVLIEMPFMCSSPRILPNEIIISRTIEFLMSSFKRSGLLDEIAQHILLQTYLNLNSLPQPTWKNQKPYQLLKDFYSLSLSSHCENSNFDTHSSELGSLSSDLNRSSSSPKQFQPVKSKRYSSSIDSESVCSLDKSFSSSYRTETESEKSYPLEELQFYSQDFRFRLSENLIYYLDIDLKSRLFYAPIQPNNQHFQSHISFWRQVKQCCIYVSDQLNLYASEINEFGTQFFCENNLGTLREKTKDDASYWIVGRKEGTEREVFFVFRCPSKSEFSNMNVEAIFQRLILHNR